MDISKTIATMKDDPAFAENVGMVLVHNGIVRAWSRGDHSPVSRVEVRVDQARVEAIRQEVERMEGIYRVLVEAHSGTLRLGDDLLFFIVAGDIRENVKPALALLLDRIKVEAIEKCESFSVE